MGASPPRKERSGTEREHIQRGGGSKNHGRTLEGRLSSTLETRPFCPQGHVRALRCHFSAAHLAPQPAPLQNGMRVGLGRCGIRGLKVWACAAWAGAQDKSALPLPLSALECPGLWDLPGAAARDCPWPLQLLGGLLSLTSVTTSNPARNLCSQRMLFSGFPGEGAARNRSTAKTSRALVSQIQVGFEVLRTP